MRFRILKTSNPFLKKISFGAGPLGQLSPKIISQEIALVCGQQLTPTSELGDVLQAHVARCADRLGVSRRNIALGGDE